METKDVLRNLRESRHLTQDQLAESVMVSRQAVSRWENGAAVGTLWSVYQHASGLSQGAHLPVLRDAPE